MIAGGGTAGSVIANRLSEVSMWKVLVLEAGGDPPITVEVPEMHLSLQNTCIDWMFKTMSDLGIYHGMNDVLLRFNLNTITASYAVSFLPLSLMRINNKLLF